MKTNTTGLILAGVVVLGAAVYALTTTTLPFGKEGLMSYVPANADQLLYLDIDEELVSVAERMQAGEVSDQNLDEVLGTLEEVVVYQLASGTVATNLLFLQGRDEISVEQIQSLGVIAQGDGYSYKKIGSHTWVYGDSDALALYNAYKGTYAANDTNIKQFLNAFHAGDYNLGFYSTPVQAASQNPLVASFATQLNYTYALSRLRLEQPFGRLVLQLSDDVLANEGSSFTPTLTKYAGNQSIFYLETKDITSLVGISDEQIKLFLPVVLGQSNPAATAGLTSTDFDKLTAALRNNIAITITPQPGLVGVGLQVVFNNPSLYPTLVTLAPLWKSFVAPLGGGTGNVEEFVSEDSVIYAIGGGDAEGTGLFAPLPPMPLLTVGKTEEVSYITLFQDAVSMTEEPITLDTTDRSKMVFRFDNQALMQAMQQSQFVQMAQQAPMNNALFSSGLVEGTLDAVPESDQIVISFQVQ